MKRVYYIAKNTELIVTVCEDAELSATRRRLTAEGALLIGTEDVEPRAFAQFIATGPVVTELPDRRPRQK